MTLRAGLFEILEPPTDGEVQAVRDVIDVHTFPWEWAVAHNVRTVGVAVFPVGFSDDPASAGFYSPYANSINVDPIGVLGEARFRQVFAHELGHLIDDTVLTRDTRTAIHRLMHVDTPYDDCPATRAGASDLWRWKAQKVAHRERPNEAFANLAPAVWCPDYAKSVDRYGPHRFDRAATIRELVMSDAEQNPPFEDIDGSPFRDDILWAAREGIAFGRDGKFEPDRPVTRGQMAAFLRRALDRT